MSPRAIGDYPKAFVTYVLEWATSRLFVEQAAFGPYSMSSAREALLRAWRQAGRYCVGSLAASRA